MTFSEDTIAFSCILVVHPFSLIFSKLLITECLEIPLFFSKHRQHENAFNIYQCLSELNYVVVCLDAKQK